MREVRYLSPTSVKKYLTDREQFFIDYMADEREDRMPQTQAMSVGSAFDAYVKAYLYKELACGSDAAFELATLLETQVEPHNLDFAREAGRKCFDAYKGFGCIADLMLMLTAGTNPRFEFTLEGSIDPVTMKLGDSGVTLLGKPDMHFINKDGCGVILDWKVNGYCSKRKPSPTRGYLNMVPQGKSHKDAIPGYINGVLCNIACYLDTGSEDWGRQLAIYGWLMGEAVGSEFITGIDQLVCCNGTIHGVAQHRSRINPAYQHALFDNVCDIWKRTREGGHFFDDMSYTDSIERCKVLNGSFGEPMDFRREL